MGGREGRLLPVLRSSRFSMEAGSTHLCQCLHFRSFKDRAGTADGRARITGCSALSGFI